MLMRDPYDEVPLPGAPLALALCQMRFPLAPQLVADEAARRIHSRLKDLFPVSRPETTQRIEVEVGPDGPSPKAPVQESAWLFETIDKSWWVNLTSDFVALSTRAYISRKDFLEKLRVVAGAVAPEDAVVVRDRIGVRYIDVVDEPDIINSLSVYVRPQLLGALAMEGAAEGVTLVHSITDSILELDAHARIRLRTGVVPPKAVIDHGVDPSGRASWFLDIDAFDEQTAEFTVDSVMAAAESLASSGYQMFRWATTEQFIDFFGGTS